MGLSFRAILLYSFNIVSDVTAFAVWNGVRSSSIWKRRRGLHLLSWTDVYHMQLALHLSDGARGRPEHRRQQSSDAKELGAE
jgi:hypothetical protein